MSMKAIHIMSKQKEVQLSIVSTKGNKLGASRLLKWIWELKKSSKFNNRRNNNISREAKATLANLVMLNRPSTTMTKRETISDKKAGITLAISIITIMNTTVHFVKRIRLIVPLKAAEAI